MNIRVASCYKSLWVDFGLATLGVNVQQDGGLEGMQGRSYVEFRDEVRSLCAKGELDRALDALFCMDQQGVVPCETIYWSLLKACNRRKALTHAKQVHAHLAKHGLSSTFLGEYLVITLSKCGGLEYALQVFHKLPHRTVFSWTAIISGYTDQGNGQEALKMLEHMRVDGVDPNEYTSASLFKACGTLAEKEGSVVVEGQLTKAMTLKVGMALHVDACKKGFDSYVFVSNTIVSMYGKCHSITEAENVFVGLSERDVVSWNAMLSAYVERGDGDEALQFYWQMQEEGVSPNERTYVAALQGCCTHAQKEEGRVVGGQLTKVMSLEIGQALHADAEKKGFDVSTFVGTSLVRMYGKCGCILEAENVFCELLQRNVVSWAAMLSAYVEQGEAEKALHLYMEMQGERVVPNERTLVIVLQACCKLAPKETSFVEGFSSKVMSLKIGQALHVDAQKQGLDQDVFVGSTLVNMYGKSGNIMDAENVFNGLSHQNVVSWTAMLSVYVEQGEGEKALMMYMQIKEDGICLDERVYVIVLQACCTLAEKEEIVVVEGQWTKVISLKIGRALHADVQCKGFDLDVYVGSTLVSMYGKCGSIMEAEYVFEGLSKQNVVLWTAMLSSYVEQGEVKKALQLYGQMHMEGMKPMEQTCLNALQACCALMVEEKEASVETVQWIKVASLKLGQALHADVLREGFDPHVLVSNALITMYGSCGSILESETVFYSLSQPNVVSWNAMLSVYMEQGEVDKALWLYRHLKEKGVTPDELTFVITLKLCCILAEREKAAVEKGRSNKIISLCIGMALHADAQSKGFDSCLFVCNALISVYGRCGSFLEAEVVFSALPYRSIVSWNAMLSMYVEQREGDKALQLYRQLEEEGVILDDTTCVCVLKACSETGRVEVCRQIHLCVMSANYYLSLVLSNALIHAYGSCASIADAQVVFDALPFPDVISWTSLIAGYAQGGDWGASLKSFEEMQLAGIKPNRVTFLSILSACSHAGLVNKGLERFESMIRDYGICPGIEHYGCMVDLFGRAGDFARVEELLSRMPMQPDLTMCLCLLGACQKHANVQLGKQVLERAQNLWPKWAVGSISMSNNQGFTNEVNED